MGQTGTDNSDGSLLLIFREDAGTLNLAYCLISTARLLDRSHTGGGWFCAGNLGCTIFLARTAAIRQHADVPAMGTFPWIESEEAINLLL